MAESFSVPSIGPAEKISAVRCTQSVGSQGRARPARKRPNQATLPTCDLDRAAVFFGGSWKSEIFDGAACSRGTDEYLRPVKAGTCHRIWHGGKWGSYQHR